MTLTGGTQLGSHEIFPCSAKVALVSATLTLRTQRILTRIRVWKYGWRVQITSEVRDKVDFIKISGRMVHDGSLVRLREHVLYELQSGIRRFVVDISEVPHLDSSGCGEVISAHTSILRANGALAFVNPTERVRLLWEWTRVREVLHIFDTLDEARQFVCK
jgi:anti-sigma B factor antagonist